MTVPQEVINERIAASRKRREEKDTRHVFPDPNNTPVTGDQRAMAMELINNVDGLAIRYIRTKPTIAIHREKLDNGKIKKTPTIARGQIVGAIVAFKVGDELRIGWSKRYVEIEDLPSTKRRALYVACLRGLADGVAVKSKNFGETEYGAVVPSSVVRELETFGHRVTKYFGVEPSNLVFVEKNALAQVATA